MFQIIFLIVLALIWITFAVVQDLRNREVANWVNFSLIIFALGFRFFSCLFLENIHFAFFYQGLIGLGIFFVLENLLYYGRMFAGGDAKLMLALGTILPFSENFFINLKIFGIFFGLFMVVGLFYSLGITIFLSLKNFKKFKKEFNKQFNKRRKFVYFSLIISIVFIILGFFEMLFFNLGIMVFVLCYFYIFLKAVDESCMIKKISPKKLTEGDWLYRNLKIGKNLIKANWDGLNKSEIKLIQKNKKFVLIRQGIAFTPVFLISFLILICIWFLGFFDFVIGFF